MDVTKTLDQAPGTMSRLSMEAEEQRLIYSRMKEEVKRTEARVYLSLKAENTNMTVKELEAKVTDNNEVYTSRLDLVEQESAYRKIECEFKAWEEALNAAKMLGKMRMSEMKTGL